MIKNNMTKFSQPLKVLSIEDNPVDQKMIKSMLTQSTYGASFFKIAKSCGEGRQILKKHTFDVILLDLNLPDSEGLITLKQFNKDYPELAIVVSTGSYEDELGIEALNYGAQDFLIKGKYNAYWLNKVLYYAIERKRLENSLKTASNQLKETQTQLFQSEKMKVVGGLASGIAHEVRNPLAAILYGVTYLQETLKTNDKKLKLTLKNIKEATNRANNIIKDLLDFSALSKLTKEKEDLHLIVDLSLGLLTHEFENCKIQIVKKFTKSMPPVKIDKRRIQQVIINLVLNSIYAMPNGGKITLKTSQHALLKDSKKLYQRAPLKETPKKTTKTVTVLHVEDTGCGIPEDKLNNIFDPFFTTRRARGGVGLGLSVCHNIMESHKGNILIENITKGGTRATLIFPN